MGRLSKLSLETWEQARAEYEVRGLSLGEIAKKFSVDRAAISRRAKTEGWVRGKNHGIVEKKLNAIKSLAEVNEESHALPMTFQATVEQVVQERLRAEGLLQSLSVALLEKGLELARQVRVAQDWESMTRGHKNLQPQALGQPAGQPAGQTVNIQNNLVASPQPQEVFRSALRGQFRGDD